MKALNAMAYIALLIVLTPIQLMLSVLRLVLMLASVLVLLAQATLTQFAAWVAPAGWGPVRKSEVRDAE